jgi:hypothetical protein
MVDLDGTNANRVMEELGILVKIVDDIEGVGVEENSRPYSAAEKYSPFARDI